MYIVPGQASILSLFHTRNHFNDVTMLVHPARLLSCHEKKRLIKCLSQTNQAAYEHKLSPGSRANQRSCDRANRNSALHCIAGDV